MDERKKPIFSELPTFIINQKLRILPLRQPDEYFPTNLPNIRACINVNTFSPEIFEQDVQTLQAILQNMGQIDDSTGRHCAGFQQLLTEVEKNRSFSNVAADTNTITAVYRQIASIFHDTGKMGLQIITNSPMVLRLEYADVVQKADELHAKYQPSQRTYEALLTKMFEKALPQKFSGFNPNQRRIDDQTLNSVRHPSVPISHSVAQNMAIAYLNLTQEASASIDGENQEMLMSIIKKAVDENLQKEVLQSLYNSFSANSEIIQDIRSVKKLLISHFRKTIDIHPVKSWERFVRSWHATGGQLSQRATAYMFGGILQHHNPTGSQYGYPQPDVIAKLQQQTFGDTTPDIQATIYQAAHWINIWDIVHAMCFDRRTYMKRKNVETFIESFKESFQDKYDDVSQENIGLMLDPEFIEKLQKFLQKHDAFIDKIEDLSKHKTSYGSFFELKSFLEIQEIYQLFNSGVE